MADDETKRVPKYKAPDFMKKQFALYYRARGVGQSLQRYGDDDAPIPAVLPVGAVRAIRPLRVSERDDFR